MTRYVAFCRVIELGSFTKAAQSLGCTQAAVSQIIHSLENELNLKLITRMHGGIRLTSSGEALYPLIQKIVATDRVVHEKAGELLSVETGEIRIGTFSSVSQNLLPPLIKLFSAVYPGVKFTLKQGDNSSIDEMLKSGSVDFGFCYPKTIHGRKVIDLCEDMFLAVLPELHPLAGRQELTLGELVEYPLIALDEGSTPNSAEEAFLAAGLTPKLKFLVHDDYTILAMIEEGLGIGILPAAILKHTNYRFNSIKITPPISRRIGIAYQSDELLSTSAHRFIDFILEHLDECTDGNFISVYNKNR